MQYDALINALTKLEIGSTLEIDRLEYTVAGRKEDYLGQAGINVISVSKLPLQRNQLHGYGLEWEDGKLFLTSPGDTEVLNIKNGEEPELIGDGEFVRCWLADKTIGFSVPSIVIRTEFKAANETITITVSPERSGDELITIDRLIEIERGDVVIT